MEDLISIIIPTFNNRETIHYHIKNIIHQTYKNIEIILIDNYSTDSTLDIIQTYNTKKHPITIIQTLENSISSNLRKALRHSNGKYIFFSSPETIVSLNFLEYCMSKIKRNKIISCDCITIPEEKLPLLYQLEITQKEEIINSQNNQEYLNNLYTNNSYYFEKTLFLYNKLIARNLLTKLKKVSNQYEFYFDILLKPKKVLVSNQKLIAKLEMDKYYKKVCYNEDDFQKIDFLEQLLLKAKKDKNIVGQLKIGNMFLRELVLIRRKLSEFYLNIENIDKLKHSTNLKFNSVYKFLTQKNYKNKTTERIFEDYQKVLKLDAAIEEYPCLYVGSIWKHANFY